MERPYYIWKLSLLGITQFVENGHVIIIIVSWVDVSDTFKSSNTLFEGSSDGSRIESSTAETTLELNKETSSHVESNSARVSSNGGDIKGENQNRVEGLKGGRHSSTTRAGDSNGPSGLAGSIRVGFSMEDTDVLETVTIS